ncbi:hypothetical protein WMF37_33645 [Sorangium sp. So ce291]|uniref:hypothetical protein n=1 Tax=Sorangium sp. So ce291 TaxID=3133294 RepID=UPI003F5EFAB9
MARWPAPGPPPAFIGGLERLAATLKAHGAVSKAAFEEGTAVEAIARGLELQGDPERTRK